MDPRSASVDLCLDFGNLGLGDKYPNMVVGDLITGAKVLSLASVDPGLAVVNSSPTSMGHKLRHRWLVCKSQVPRHRNQSFGLNLKEPACTLYAPGLSNQRNSPSLDRCEPRSQVPMYGY